MPSSETILAAIAIRRRLPLSQGLERPVLADERPRRFERLCLRALAEGAISGARAAELLDVSLRDVDGYMRGTVPLPGGGV